MTKYVKETLKENQKLRLYGQGTNIVVKYGNWYIGTATTTSELLKLITAVEGMLLAYKWGDLE